MFIVGAVSGLVGARLGVTDNLVHIQYATDNVQDTIFCRLHRGHQRRQMLTRVDPRSRALRMPDSDFNPAYIPPLPPPDNFALDDVISDQMTLGAVAYSSDPA